MWDNGGGDPLEYWFHQASWAMSIYSQRHLIPLFVVRGWVSGGKSTIWTEQPIDWAAWHNIISPVPSEGWVEVVNPLYDISRRWGIVDGIPDMDISPRSCTCIFIYLHHYCINTNNGRLADVILCWLCALCPRHFRPIWDLHIPRETSHSQSQNTYLNLILRIVLTDYYSK